MITILGLANIICLLGMLYAAHHKNDTLELKWLGVLSALALISLATFGV